MFRWLFKKATAGTPKCDGYNEVCRFNPDPTNSAKRICEVCGGEFWLFDRPKSISRPSLVWKRVR